VSDPAELPGPVTDAVTTPPAGDSPSDAPPHRPHSRPPRAGELTVGWRAVTAATWIGVVVGLAAVWNASVQLGLSTWWLGARADPQPRYIQFLPFVPPVLMLLATINQMRWLPWMGLASAAFIGAIGVADIGRVTSLAAVEIAIAGAAAAVSIASLTGTYRRDDSVASPDDAAS
jgi:hypothetical protein